MVERIVAEVNVIVASSALVLRAFASVAGIVLGTRVCNFHHDTSSVASAVT